MTGKQQIQTHNIVFIIQESKYFFAFIVFFALCVNSCTISTPSKPLGAGVVNIIDIRSFSGATAQYSNYAKELIVLEIINDSIKGMSYTGFSVEEPILSSSAALSKRPFVGSIDDNGNYEFRIQYAKEEYTIFKGKLGNEAVLKANISGKGLRKIPTEKTLSFSDYIEFDEIIDNEITLNPRLVKAFFAKEQADLKFKSNIAYPDLVQFPKKWVLPKYDKFIKKHFEAITAKALVYSSNNRDSVLNEGLSKWCILDNKSYKIQHFDKNYISYCDTLICISPQQNKKYIFFTTINYDFQANRPLSIKDIFKESSDVSILKSKAISILGLSPDTTWTKHIEALKNTSTYFDFWSIDKSNLYLYFYSQNDSIQLEELNIPKVKIPLSELKQVLKEVYLSQ